ncbi:MAG TPA: hypothetical protein VLS90_10570, partial [Thermodesulfobacteriota bacterium]|nr:hypothetical protein [Thermodesulfobacteriota bacterium]
MKSIKAFLIVVILVVAAFGVGYGLEFWNFRTAQKEWDAAKSELQSRIGTLEAELAKARAREKLREISDTLDEAAAQISEKNFGLAVKTLDGLKESYLQAEPSLSPEMKKRFEFLLPSLEEAKSEISNMSPNAGKKIEDIRKGVEES